MKKINQFVASLIVSLLLGVTLPIMANAATAVATEPNLSNCTGYSEPRLPLETQNWWTRNASNLNPLPNDVLNGDDEHAHLRVCFPAGNQVVSGPIRFDLQWAGHNVPDGRVEFLRIQSATDQGGVDTIINEDLSTETSPLCAGVNDCSGVLTVTLNTDILATGMHELRFHHDYGRADGARMLATTGWTICIRSCIGVTPQAVANSGAEQETRGRWREADGSQYGYSNSRLRSPLPWTPEAGYTALTGNWCPHLRTLAGAGGDPVIRSFVSVDPAFHANPGTGGNPGLVILDQPNSINAQTCIDTTVLANGLHKLFVRADSINGADLALGIPGSGVNGGVFVIPFLVNNEIGTTTTTTISTTTTTTTSPTTTTTTSPPSMAVAITNVWANRVISGWVGIDVATTGPVACVRYYLNDFLKIAEDCSPSNFDEPWNSITVQNGNYLLSARAFDTLGNSVSSTSIPIAVAN